MISTLHELETFEAQADAGMLRQAPDQLLTATFLDRKVRLSTGFHKYTNVFVLA